MKHWTIARMFAGGVLLLFAGLTVSVALALNDRQITLKKGEPIEERILPTDQQLLVVADTDPPLEVSPPDGTTEVQWLTQLSPIVAIIEVKQLKPWLTEDRDWIKSTVTAEVIEVIKGDLTTGQTVTFDVDGGEMMIKGTKVRGEVSWKKSFRKNAQYLVFTGWKESAPARVLGAPYGFRLTDEGTLEQLGGATKPLDGVPAAATLAEIRAAAAQSNN